MKEPVRWSPRCEVLFQSRYAKALKVLSKSGVSDILFCLSKEQKRFSQIMFETRLNPGVLARHLKELMSLGVITKDGKYYALSERGMMVVDVLRKLRELRREFYGAEHLKRTS